MSDIRADQVVKDLISFKATVLMINAAGIIASYPTRLPYHFQSPYLKGDSLLKIIEACHAENIRVIARTDFSKVRRPVFDLHPEWAYRSVKGEPVDYNGDVHVCVNSWYQQEGILHILDELFSTHPFDGVFFNMGGYVTHDYSGRYYGPCVCENCKRRFQALYSQKFPFSVREDNSSRSYSEFENDLYLQFKNHTLQDQESSINHFLTARFPHLCIANHLSFERGFIRQESNTALERPLPLWQYSASENTKWAVGSHPAMVCSNTSVDFIDFPYRHVAVSPFEQALRLAQNLANGGSLDYYLIGRLDNHADRSGYAPVKEIYAFHAEYEQVYRGLKSMAEIALIKPSAGNLDEYRGWFRTLVEAHYPFDVLTVDAAMKKSVIGYRCVILPDVGFLEEQLSQTFINYVAGGGVILVTGKPPTLMLPCMGVEEIISEQIDLRSPYFLVEEKQTFPRLRDTDLIYLEGLYEQARYSSDAQKFLQLIQPHPYGPPERCYYEQNQVTDLPGLVRHPSGRGLAIYLPWQPGKQFFHRGQVNTFCLMADVLEHQAGMQPLGGNLSEQVEATLFQNSEGAILLHIVNTSGHYGNSYYPPISMKDLHVTIPWEGEAPGEVIALKSGLPIKTEIIPGRLALLLPWLGQFEVLQIFK